METFGTVVNIIFGVAFGIFACFVLYVLFNDIRDAIEDHDYKKLYQWTGIIVVCIAVFILCRTVFKDPLQDLSLILRGHPVVTTGENFSISWQNAPDIVTVDDISTEDIIRGMEK